MNKLLSLLVFIPFASTAQKTVELKFISKILHENRTIWINLPKYYELRKDSFHVIYLFDGDNQSLLNLTVSSKRFLEANAVDLNDFNAPESIIIGIEQKSRGTDFVDSAVNFLKFLTDELMPYIKKMYRTVAYNILIGHSLGGRFSIYSFLKR